ncbi:hypothetical protein [Paraflavitalea sp. CAU 1676]|uniref:hypothetical protein n=1 Tax=Paraflavitalea sp. CAU 1676 TaxID=3032598 RepID=UPI0023DC1CAC|nr:hypothetical protein [Paraflavitalea sp. CAU 1676]MDF2191377.1 hypothetical protein [Paraflavitalea sp. CAU 1676]
MNIEHFLEIARKEFTALPNNLPEHLVHHYAAEELNLTETELTDFLRMATDLNSDYGSVEQVNRFYIWYYLNYGRPIVQDDTELTIIGFPHNTLIQSFSTQPESEQMEGSTSTYLPCEPQFADRWQLVAIDWEEKRYPVLTCRDELIVLKLKKMFVFLLKQR